ncbi:MAG: UDP-glucose 4-epimerase GalE [Lachnospiraceae bacterium]|jgi:UDP-glucose 4-epimerase|nr:UDP-glucose 4-epimerase GalE [Lachnospiraceae bacterium]
MRILVTGGAGYIGSHTCVELLGAGYRVVVVDNLANSNEESLRRVQEITGKGLTFVKADLLDRAALDALFYEHPIDAVIHFAGLKAVGESVYKPLEYYHNNITGTLALCDVMRSHGVKSIVFSSSATVYGDPAQIPITEGCPKGEIMSPYGRTKGMLEQILTDLHTADPGWQVMLLRYFNPIGAHISGRIGEDPKGIPNNLVPYVSQVAVGKLEKLGIFGHDYPTPDGTCIRDYIHVVDLAVGHVKALGKMMGAVPKAGAVADSIKGGIGTSDRDAVGGVWVYNLGTGVGYSVLDVIHAYETANNIKIPYEFKPRRAGDVPVCYSDATKARDELGWVATHTLEDMCRDSYRWQSANPRGYEG